MESLDHIIKMALSEDIGRGDITTLLLIEEDASAKANVIAKEDFVLAGVSVFRRTFEIVSAGSSKNNLAVIQNKCDGASVKAGDVIISINGSLRTILSAERVALNFLQHLSAVATVTSRFVSIAKEFGVRVVDTRKTTPNLRMLEKYAVTVGGGDNHRIGLYDRILIKDNHIKHRASVYDAVTVAKSGAPQGMIVEVETKDLDEVRDAVRAGADIIMFDNMTPQMVKEAVGIVGNSAKTEVSGGITLANIRQYASMKPTFISVGALTHSACAVDISLLIE